MSRPSNIRTYRRAECVTFRKTGEAFGGLSNMAPGFPVRVNGVRIFTVEALYQACRFPHRPEVQRYIIDQTSPMTAKMVSKPYRTDSRQDWDRVRVKIMRWCLRMKLTQHWPKFSQLLLSTGDRPIVEDSRKDSFWGALPAENQTLVGMNVLGRLLMELREAIRQGVELRRVEPPTIYNFLLLGKPLEVVDFRTDKSVPPVPAKVPAIEFVEEVDLQFPEDGDAATAPPKVESLPVAPLAPVEKKTAMVEGLQPYKEYKQSEQEWLGRIPAHWILKPGHAAFKKRKIPNIGLKEKTVLSLSFGRIKVKATDRQHGLVPGSYETYQVVDKGNIIIRGTDLQNDQTSLRIGLSRNRGIISSAYLCLEARETVTPEYGYQILNTFDLTKAIYRYGSGLRQNLDHGEIKRLPIFLPPLEEQTSIVKFLDHANRKIDSFIVAKGKLIGLLDEQKQAITHRAVTRGLNPDVRLKPSGIPWLGDIPALWEVKRAKQICTRIIDCKNRTPDMVPNGEFIVVRTTNIRHGKFNPVGSYPTSRKYYDIWVQRGAPQLGDVFFTREAPVGEACLVPNHKNLCMGQRMMYFRPDPAMLDAEFLLHSIYGPLVRTYIEHHSNGSTVGHLRLGQVYSLPLLWCPLAEQKAIVCHINTAFAPLNRAIARTNREIVLMQEYRTRLTADIVTGKLDVREAATKLTDLPNETAPEPIADEALEEVVTEE